MGLARQRSEARLLRIALASSAAPAEAEWRAWRLERRFDELEAGEQALIPAAYVSLRRLGIEDSLLASLAGVYKHTWFRNQLALRGLGEALTALRAASVRAMVLKGLPLAVLYHRDLGARPMKDFDLLVPEPQIGSALGALRAAGFEPEDHVVPEPLRPFLSAMALRHRRHGVLDLHWRAFTPDAPKASEERFWRQAEHADLGGHEALVPDATQLFLLVCLSRAKRDPQSSGRWVLDARVLSSALGFSWSAVLDCARGAGLMSIVAEACGVLSDDYELKIPGPEHESLRSYRTTRAERARLRELLASTATSRGPVASLRSHLWRWRAARRAGRSRLGFLRYYVAFKRWEWREQNPMRIAWRLCRAVAGRQAEKRTLG